MRIRKLLAVILVSFAFTSLLYANGAMEAYAAESTKSETFVYTDSLGREITLPRDITRVAPSGNVAQLAIYAVAPEKMVGWSSKISGDAMKTFLPDVAKLPVFGAFYGKKANLNKEALIAADPQVVIDVGEIKGSAESMAKQLDELSAEIGIPVVFVEGYLKNTGDMFRSIGKILGKEAEAETLAAYSEKALEMAAKNHDSVNKSIYYSSSQDGLAAIETGSFHGELIEVVGAENVVPATFSGSNGTTSLENLLLWNPDVILLSNKDAYDNALSDKAWGELDAVKNGSIYLIPSSPYSFIDSPPATNRIIGIYWLGSVLAPDAYNVDIEKEVRDYYSLFYHKSLSDEELRTIL